MHRNKIGERPVTDEKSVLEGLMRRDKYISSRFLYDGEGSRLFQRIMKMPEYYLYQAEFEILRDQGNRIVESLPFKDRPFRVVELGAGDGSKTIELLRWLMKNDLFRGYWPVDISSEATKTLGIRLAEKIPALKVYPVNGNYDRELVRMIPSDEAVLLLFLGSNIGNFNREKIQELMLKFGSHLKTGDAVLVGFDLKKHPEIIRRAYDDAEGITSSFNMNLLTRFNREMGADFKTEQFDFYSFYDPISGEVRSYLISLCRQEVHFPYSGVTVVFEKNEPIHTEISKKFDLPEIEQLFGESGFHDLQIWKDENEYYADALAVRR